MTTLDESGAGGRPGGAVRPPDTSAGARRPAGPPWSVVVVALAVALVSLAVAAASLLLSRGAGTGAADTGAADRDSALAAARERTEDLTSYDFTTLDADTKAVLATATGEFAKDYAATSAQLRPTFTSRQAVATAKVVGAGLESVQADRVVAVLAVDQVIMTRGAAPRTERNRLRMTLVRPDGTWLVERVERL